MSIFEWCVLSISIWPQFITFYWTRSDFNMNNLCCLCCGDNLKKMLCVFVGVFSDENAHFDTLRKRLRMCGCVHCTTFIILGFLITCSYGFGANVQHVLLSLCVFMPSFYIHKSIERNQRKMKKKKKTPTKPKTKGIENFNPENWNERIRNR